MIIGLSGKNGNGKSNWLVSNVNKEFPDRKVYYHGIKGVDESLEWTKLEDPKTWYDLPTGSVVIFDEAHLTFGARSGKIEVPEFIKQLTIHREKGFDIYFATTMPENLDVYLRRHINKHLHFRRILGTETANLYEWDYFKTGVDDLTKIDTSDAIKTIFKFDKSVYGKYHSAQQHTVKKKIPWVFWALPIPAILAAYLIYSAFTRFDSYADDIPQALPPNSDTGLIRPSPKKVIAQSSDGIVINTVEDYLIAYTPLIKDLPHTAPIYQELTTPTVVPFPHACVNIRNKCTCWTQQATKLNISQQSCKNFIANGLFKDFGNHSNPSLPVQHSSASTTAD